MSEIPAMRTLEEGLAAHRYKKPPKQMVDIQTMAGLAEWCASSLNRAFKMDHVREFLLEGGEKHTWTIELFEDGIGIAKSSKSTACEAFQDAWADMLTTIEIYDTQGY